VAFVHGGGEDEADRWFTKYGLADVTRISDPGLAHYRAFGLERAGVPALVAPGVQARGAVCARPDRRDDAAAARRLRRAGP
jgi:hypothetical protein